MTNNSNTIETLNCVLQPCGCLGQCLGYCRYTQGCYSISAPPTKLQTADTLGGFSSDARLSEETRKKLADAAAALRESHAEDLLQQAKRMLGAP